MRSEPLAGLLLVLPLAACAPRDHSTSPEPSVAAVTTRGERRTLREGGAERLPPRPPPERARLAFERGNAALRRDLLAAIEHYGQAIAAHAFYVEAYYNRAWAHQQRGALREARADYSRCLALTPGDAKVWVNRAIACKDLGDLPAARADVDRALELDPRDGLAWSTHAQVLQLEGDRAGALAAFARAIELGHAKAHYHRALLYAEDGDWAAVRSDCERCLERHPDQPEVVELLERATAQVGGK